MELADLFDMLCCCGDDHTVREGGEFLNSVMLDKLATWPYLTAMNVLVPESKNYPLATAIVCDRCLGEKKPFLYAAGGKEGPDGPEYFRVPVDNLEKPTYYWPDHHPDREELNAA